MRSRHILIVCAAAALVLAPSCHKKDDTTDSTSYLDGEVTFTMPSYVLQGEEFTLTPSGASNPTTGNLGYYWYSSWDSTKDTTKTESGSGNGSWTVTVPDEIGTYTITCQAFASGYYNLSMSKTIYVVDPAVGVSLKGTSYQIDSLTLKDPRDGSVYYLATAGGNLWTQNNLHYTLSGVSFDNCPAMDGIFGRLYTWEEAMAACPEGWHLPSDSDFALLAESFVDGASFEAGDPFTGAAGALMADAYFMGSKMWTFWPAVKITDESKFSAIPVGYAVDQEGMLKFYGANSYAVFWTSDETPDAGIYRYIYVDKNNVYLAPGDKSSFRASVRCVKDKN